jgi:regulator of replication initiation timing
MITCKNYECPQGHGNICCAVCPDGGCAEKCTWVPENCGSSITEQAQELIPFQSKAMAIMQKIVDLNIQKKQLEAQDKDVRQQLEKVMGEYGIKQFENDLLKVTYVEPTTRTTIDSTKLKKDLPAIAEKYSKVSQVKGSVRIEVK